MACQRVSGCPLFQAFSVKSSLRVWQAYYCEGAFDRCARWRRVVSGETVPVNLLPNGRMLDVPLERLEPTHLM